MVFRSHLDYCNALLAGLPKVLIWKLQMVQNAEARVLCRVPKHDHIQPTLKELHWLPVAFRIKYKVCVLTHKALYGSGPSYIKDMLQVKSSEYSLRSTDTLTLEVPKTNCKTLGDRSFQAVAPREWNVLPSDLRVVNDFNVFKCRLKTHFFSLAYTR